MDLILSFTITRVRQHLHGPTVQYNVHESCVIMFKLCVRRSRNVFLFIPTFPWGKYSIQRLRNVCYMINSGRSRNVPGKYSALVISTPFLSR